MSSNNWKYYRVTLEVSWMSGANPCDAEVTMLLHAKSPNHAASRAREQIDDMANRMSVDDVSVKEERI